MPLVAHRDLESLARIRAEGQEVLDVERALHQDIRELHIGLLNIMPDGALKATERQFLRLIGNCNRIAQFYVHIFTVPGVPRSEEMQAYIDQNYESFDTIKAEGLDALIVTGTNPVHDDFADEPFWPHTRDVLAWADLHVSSVLCSCLASHAAFEHFYGLKREPLAEKLFGVYSHRVLNRTHPLLSNINTRFDMPHSRRNDVSQAALESKSVPVLVASEAAGVALSTSSDGFKRIYLQGHPEYDEQSLLKEYCRDVQLYFDGEREDLPQPPLNYFSPRGLEILDGFINDVNSDMRSFPLEALAEEIDITWRDTAKAIFANWLGFVYQLTHRERTIQFMDGVDPNDPLNLAGHK
ncbi:homoserine O-succinyltransferase [Suttonella sp. R2A3]|uniref:homoserine O-succinyltransferase MetA n=1 Tax=Suttonella sp. R2A3 TaxID=2908648 RepID=UPI001F3956B4|nr:homoserine O-succinyltransferase [Suttonella sp. R2A3]UJF25052.1 homoserine O-succinyltransferase [Suttonella sp. R2A3]